MKSNSPVQVMLKCHTTLQVQTLEGKTFAVIVELRELSKTGKQLSNIAL